MATCPGQAPICEQGKKPVCLGPPHGTGYWSCITEIPGTGGTPPGTCPNGQHWDQAVRACVTDTYCPPDPPCAPGQKKQIANGVMTCVPCGTPDPPATGSDGCPPGQHRGGGHPGNPCKPDAPGTPAPPSGSQTITELLKRFYTPNWDDYLLSGQLGAGIPQPTDPLLGLLQNSLFQQAVGRYGIGPQQQWQMNMQTDLPGRQGAAPGALRRMFGEDPGERPEAILGLQGGGAALGYIDPSWLSDWTQKTVPAPGTPPGTSPPGTAPPGTTPPGTTPGNPCGSTQGCPPGQHRGGCHPGNPCKPDTVATAQVIGGGGLGVRPSGAAPLGNPGTLLNPGGLLSGLSTRPQFTSQVLRR